MQTIMSQRLDADSNSVKQRGYGPAGFWLSGVMLAMTSSAWGQLEFDCEKGCTGIVATLKGNASVCADVEVKVKGCGDSDSHGETRVSCKPLPPTGDILSDTFAVVETMIAHGCHTHAEVNGDRSYTATAWPNKLEVGVVENFGVQTWTHTCNPPMHPYFWVASANWSGGTRPDPSVHVTIEFEVTEWTLFDAHFYIWMDAAADCESDLENYAKWDLDLDSEGREFSIGGSNPDSVDEHYWIWVSPECHTLRVQYQGMHSSAGSSCPFPDPENCSGDTSFFARLTVESSCLGDIDGDGSVGFSDMTAVLAVYDENEPCLGCPEDFDGDGFVRYSDLLIVLGNWGSCQ